MHTQQVIMLLQNVLAKGSLLFVFAILAHGKSTNTAPSNMSPPPADSASMSLVLSMLARFMVTNEMTNLNDVVQKCPQLLSKTASQFKDQEGQGLFSTVDEVFYTYMIADILYKQ